MSSHDQEESIVNTRDSSISRHSVVPHSPPIAHHESNQSNGSFSHYNPPPHVPSVESLLSSERPIYSSAPHLTVVQTHCLSRHKRWRSSKNMQASIACALCFTEKDDLSDENGAGERWSCIWCALRVCLPCRNLVEQYMGRDPERALIGSEFQRRPGGPPPWAMARTPFGPGPGLLPNGALAPPPNVFGMGHAAGWHSTSDLHAGSGRGSAVGSRRASASTMTASARPSLEVRDSATSIRGRKTQMSDVVGIDDDATPRKPSAMSAYGERGHPSMDADRRTMSFTSRSPLGMREEG